MKSRFIMTRLLRLGFHFDKNFLGDWVAKIDFGIGAKGNGSLGAGYIGGATCWITNARRKGYWSYIGFTRNGNKTPYLQH